MGFAEAMRRGLTQASGSLKMIPSYVGRPTGKEQGTYLALDLGGTNLRVLAVRLDGQGGAATDAASRFVVPQDRMRGEGTVLFDFLADCLSLFFKNHRLDRLSPWELGFTFSFPVAQTAVNAGALLTWTKGFTASGVEGQNVAALLANALARKNLSAISVAALCNDTVGTLSAKSYADPSCDMGVILGTGTNACYVEETQRIEKLNPSLPGKEMIINLEWGNFDHLETNVYDQTLDRASFNPGRQRMEKMVSGMYLGELVRLMVVDMIEQGELLKQKDASAFACPYSVTSEHMAKTFHPDDFFASFGIDDAAGRDGVTIARVCRMVSARAARIAAAAIAAVILRMDKDLGRRHTVAIDGSLYEKYPGFEENMRGMLEELFASRAVNIRLARVSDGSGIGAAVIAAVAAANRPQG